MRHGMPPFSRRSIGHSAEPVGSDVETTMRPTCSRRCAPLHLDSAPLVNERAIKGEQDVPTLLTGATSSSLPLWQGRGRRLDSKDRPSRPGRRLTS